MEAVDFVQCFVECLECGLKRISSVCCSFFARLGVVSGG